MPDDNIQDATLRTITEIDTYMDIARIHVRAWHANVNRWRRLYDFEHYSERALPYEERYSDPTPTNVVDLAVGVILANEIEWTARGWEPEVDEEEASSEIEKFLAGVIYINSERHEYHLPYESTLHIVRDGAAVIYSVWDPVLDQQYKTVVTDPETGEKRVVYREAPIRTQIIDPKQIYLLPGGPKRWSHIIREWEMSVADVETVYAIKLSKYHDISLKDKHQTKVSMRDYWRFVAKDVDGTKVHAVENSLTAGEEVVRPLREMDGYDDLPFTLGFFKPINRDNSGSWHGILRPIETTIEHVEKAINRRNRQILVYSSLPFIARTLPTRKLSLDPALGNLITLSRDEGLEFPTWPGNAPDVEMHIDYLRSRLQQAGFADVMFGSGSSQVSGYALSQLGDQNRIRLEQPVQHIQMMWTIWARKTLRLVKNFTADGTEIRVYGNMRGQNFASRLKVGDLDSYMVKASVKPEYPNEKVRNHAMAAQVSNILSESTLMQNYLGIKQPDEEKKKRIMDMAMKHPLMQQFAVMQTLIRYAQGDDKLLAAAASLTIQQMQAGQQQAQQVGPGRPELPPGAPNALGTPSATGQVTPQEAGGEPAAQSFEETLQSLASGQGIGLT